MINPKGHLSRASLGLAALIAASPLAAPAGPPATVGSIEYAVEHLGAPLVVVMGHHRCGAVKATVEVEGPVEGSIGAIVREIEPAVESTAATRPGRTRSTRRCTPTWPASPPSCR